MYMFRQRRMKMMMNARKSFVTLPFKLIFGHVTFIFLTKSAN